MNNIITYITYAYKNNEYTYDEHYCFITNEQHY